jgi:hypothetical protein
MSRFITVHRAPGLSAEEIAANTPEVLKGQHATFQHLYVDMIQGFIVTIYDAEDSAALEREFERIGFPWDEIHDLQFDADHAALTAMAASGSH